MQSMGSQRIVHDLVTEHQQQVGCSELGAWVTSTKQRASPLRSRFPESPKQVDPKTKSTALTPEALLLLGPRLTHREQGNLSTSCGSLHTLDCFIAPLTGLKSSILATKSKGGGGCLPHSATCEDRVLDTRWLQRGCPERWNHRETRASPALRQAAFVPQDQVTSPSEPQISSYLMGRIFFNSFPLWIIIGH